MASNIVISSTPKLKKKWCFRGIGENEVGIVWEGNKFVVGENGAPKVIRNVRKNVKDPSKVTVSFQIYHKIYI